MPKLKHLLNLDYLQDNKDLNATHVVTQISWGASCSVTCEYMNTGQNNITDVHGSLIAAINKIKCVLDVGGGVGV